MMDCTRLRTPATILCAALLAPGCIIASSDDDDLPVDSTTGEPGTGGGPGGTTATTTPSTTSPETTGTSGDDTTGGFPDDCTDNLVEDGGFEGGTPNAAWEEHSEIFPSLICDASCTEDPGAGPFAGDYFVWFGGLDDTQTDVAWVTQDLEIAPTTAFLRFRLAISGHEPQAGDNVFAVELDDETVFMVTDIAQPEYEGYQVVDVDVSAFADGETHTLRFVAEFPGTLLTNFFLDEVELVSCDDEGGTSTGTTGTTGDAESSTGVVDDTGTDSSTGTTGDAESSTGPGTTGNGD